MQFHIVGMIFFLEAENFNYIIYMLFRDGKHIMKSYVCSSYFCRL